MLQEQSDVAGLTVTRGSDSTHKNTSLAAPADVTGRKESGDNSPESQPWTPGYSAKKNGTLCPVPTKGSTVESHNPWSGKLDAVSVSTAFTIASQFRLQTGNVKESESGEQQMESMSPGFDRESVIGPPGASGGMVVKRMNPVQSVPRSVARQQ